VCSSDLSYPSIRPHADGWTDGGSILPALTVSYKRFKRPLWPLFLGDSYPSACGRTQVEDNEKFHF